MIELGYEHLKTSYFKLVIIRHLFKFVYFILQYLYSFSKKRDLPKGSLKVFKQDLQYNASILINMSTIAFGPEHHDLKMIDSYTVKFN